jgi:hypothetical protein
VRPASARSYTITCVTRFGSTSLCTACLSGGTSSASLPSGRKRCASASAGSNTYTSDPLTIIRMLSSSDCSFSCDLSLICCRAGQQRWSCWSGWRAVAFTRGVTCERRLNPKAARRPTSGAVAPLTATSRLGAGSGDKGLAWLQCGLSSASFRGLRPRARGAVRQRAGGRLLI